VFHGKDDGLHELWSGIVSSQDDSHKTIVFHGKDDGLHELWSGIVSSQDDYQVMMDILNRFIEEYKNNPGAA
jgi:hypothetical protein